MAEKQKTQKHKIAEIIEGENIGDIVKKAGAALEADGGVVRNATMLMHLSGDSKVGAGIALKGDQDLADTFTQALGALQRQGFDDNDDYVLLTVTLIDGGRMGCAYGDSSLDLKDYRVGSED